MSKRILIIDDEVEFATTLCQRLKLRKFEVEEAHSGNEGLAILKDFVPNIVFLDLKMPDMSGLDVLAEIRSVQPQSKVVMLTGHGSGAAGKQALAMGAVDYLMKPVDFRELIKRVTELTGGQEEKDGNG